MIRCKVQPSHALGGRFNKDDFSVDPETRTVTCPAGRVVPIQGVVRRKAGFGRSCAVCPLMTRCTASPHGRRIKIGLHEALLARGRAAQRAGLSGRSSRDPAARRAQDHAPHAPPSRGRQARVRGRLKVGADFALLAAIVNLARLAVLGLVRSGGSWIAQTA